MLPESKKTDWQMKLFRCLYSVGTEMRVLLVRVRHDAAVFKKCNRLSIEGRIYRRGGRDGFAPYAVDTMEFWYDADETKKHLHRVMAEYAPHVARLYAWDTCTVESPYGYYSSTVLCCNALREGWDGDWEMTPDDKVCYAAIAREAARWPDATDADLLLPEDELRKKLEDRLPALMLEFKEAVEAVGMVY